MRWVVALLATMSAFGQAPQNYYWIGGTVTGSSNLTTVGAIPYVSAPGVLTQDANFTYSTTNGATIVGLTFGKGVSGTTTNTAVGFNVLSTAGAGSSNTGVGYNALASIAAGGFNTAVGTGALQSSNANHNTAVGRNALTSATGAQNTALGSAAGGNVSSGQNNTFVGYSSGGGITTGSSNTVIGAGVVGLSAGLSNTVILADGDGVIRMYSPSSGNTLFGGTTDGNYFVDVQKSGSSGTLRVKDQTATTGATRVLIDLGAADTSSTAILTVNGAVKFGGSNSTGAGSALLGANSPASTLTAPYTWIKAVSSDGSTVYIPAWK